MDDLEQAGDYCLDLVTVKGAEVPQVWFLLPIHEGGSKFERITEGSGLHGISSPPWTFRECDDGSLEIRASILCGRTDERPEGYFHGLLNEGNVWTWS